MKPIFRVFSAGACMFVLGQGWAWAETGPASSLSNSVGAAAVSGEPSFQGTSLAAENVLSNSPCAVASPGSREDGTEVQRDNLLLVVKFCLPEVTILRIQNGEIYFKYKDGKDAYRIKSERVERVSEDLPAGYAKLRPGYLPRGYLRDLGRKEAKALIASSATDNGSVLIRPNEKSGSTQDESKSDFSTELVLKKVNLLLAGKFYLPEVTIFYHQDGVFHFKYKEEEQVYVVADESIECVTQNIPSGCFELWPGDLAKSQVITRTNEVRYPRVPHKRGKLVGISRQIKNDVTYEPLGYWVGTSTLRYERLLGRYASVVAGLKHGSGVLLSMDVYHGGERRSLGAELGFRFFPVPTFYAPRGPWIGFTGEYINDYFKDCDASVSYRKAVMEVGWKFILIGDRMGFVVSPYLGGGYSWSYGGPLLNKYNGDQIAPDAPWVLFFGCDFGFGF